MCDVQKVQKLDKCNFWLRFRSRFRNETVPNITDLRNEVSQDAPPGVERARRQTRGALWALCHLGDAAVPNPGEVFNCSEARDGEPSGVFPHQTTDFRCGEVVIFRSCCHPTTCRWGALLLVCSKCLVDVCQCQTQSWLCKVCRFAALLSLGLWTVAMPWSTGRSLLFQQLLSRACGGRCKCHCLEWGEGKWSFCYSDMAYLQDLITINHFSFQHFESAVSISTR